MITDRRRRLDDLATVVGTYDLSDIELVGLLLAVHRLSRNLDVEWTNGQHQLLEDLAAVLAAASDDPEEDPPGA